MNKKFLYGAVTVIAVILVGYYGYKHFFPTPVGLKIVRLEKSHPYPLWVVLDKDGVDPPRLEVWEEKYLFSEIDSVGEWKIKLKNGTESETFDFYSLYDSEGRAIPSTVDANGTEVRSYYRWPGDITEIKPYLDKNF